MMRGLVRAATSRLDGWIHGFHSPSNATLGLYRMFFAAWVLLMLPFETRFIDGFPPSFFHPPVSIVRWLPGFPPVAFFWALDVAALVLGCALLLGIRTRMASLFLFAVTIVGKSFVFSFGKTVHSILDFVPLVMAFSGWGERFSIDAASGRSRDVAATNSPPIALMALLVGFGMFSAGIEKALFGWLGFDAQASYAHALLYESLGIGWVGPGSLRSVSIPWLFEMADWFVVLLEVGFLVAVLSITAFRLTCTLAAVFHFNNVWFLRITSTSFAALYPLFFDWTRLERRWGARLDAIYARLATSPLLAIGVLSVVVASLRAGFAALDSALGDAAEAAWLGLGGAIWGVQIVLGVRAHVAASSRR